MSYNVREQLTDRTVDGRPGSLRTATTQEEGRTKRQPRVDPLERVAEGVFGRPTAANHALVLGQATDVQSAWARGTLMQLQRRYGNRHLQRVLNLARQGDGQREVGADIESAIERKRGAGQALDSTVRLQMESAFGADFSGVRVHTDSEAHSLNDAVSAIAFTTGKDIFFRQGAYSPGSSGGKELLAHELTHVVQQGGSSTVRGSVVVGEPDDSYEAEADRMARSVVSTLESRAVNVCQAPSPVSTTMQRQCACGGHTGSGGKCEECRQKREAALESRVMSQAERRFQKQDDGGDGQDGGPQPTGVVDLCAARNIPCPAVRGHPFKGMVGWLTSCYKPYTPGPIKFTCTYRFPDGDECVWYNNLLAVCTSWIPGSTSQALGSADQVPDSAVTTDGGSGAP